MIVVFTREAEADLERIGDFIAENDPQRAVTFVDELVDRCLSLVAHPERFPRLPRHAATDIRRFPYKAYLVFYRVGDERIEILHILHSARDYEAVLFPAR